MKNFFAVFVSLLVAACAAPSPQDAPSSETVLVEAHLPVTIQFSCEFRVHTGASQKTELVADPGLLTAIYRPTEAIGLEKGMIDGMALDIGGYRAELNIWRSTTEEGVAMTDVTTILYIPDAEENHGERAIGWSENSVGVERWRTAAIDWTGRFIKIEDADGSCERAEDLVERGQVVTLTCERSVF